MPISKDALLGAERSYDLAEIYVMVGEYDSAIELLNTLMSIPFRLSIHLLRFNSHWDSLLDHPRFQALLEKYETSN